jgi:hypothetical protein
VYVCHVRLAGCWLVPGRLCHAEATCCEHVPVQPPQQQKSNMAAVKPDTALACVSCMQMCQISGSNRVSLYSGKA